MLFILFGATLDLGYESRCIFKNKGFNIVKKYNFVSEDAKVDKSKYINAAIDLNYQKWYDKIYVDKDAIAQFDFKYDLDGVQLGFNQDEIMDAVRGEKDCLLTIGASSISLLTQLKKAYGDYVTSIYIFEDNKSVLDSVNVSKK